jgi:hypothetical protein
LKLLQERKAGGTKNDGGGKFNYDIFHTL